MSKTDRAKQKKRQREALSLYDPVPNCGMKEAATLSLNM